MIKSKIKLIITEEKIVLKIYVKKLKKSATEIIDHKEKEMLPLTHKENNFYNEQEVCLYMQRNVLHG